MIFYPELSQIWRGRAWCLQKCRNSGEDKRKCI